jgi:LysR family cys regulon transcriptional activator
MAYDPDVDTDLVAIEAGHLFDSSVTSIGFRKGSYLRGYMYDFIAEFAPHLTRDVVDRVMMMPSKMERDAFFSTLELPVL